MSRTINEKKLHFDIIQKVSDLSIINSDKKDEADTLNVRNFLLKDAKTYRENNLTSVWKVSYKKKPIAFFTISMNGMEANKIPTNSRVGQMRGRYPAILLGQMYVLPEFRGRRISYWICQFVVGLARRINPRIACSCVVLQTDDSKITLYEKARFVKSIKTESGLTWMYQSTQ